MELTVKELAELFQVENTDNTELSSVEFDSRLITPGGLFVPLAGQRDGHDFIEQAIANGAVATFWSKPLNEAPAEISVIPVSEPLRALQKLARYYQAKIAPKIIAITGSNGKTTTKDMTAAVLAQKYQTYKTQGNYNNEIGMPYTILHMPATTEFLVLEMGMDHAGEIEVLSKMAQPDAAAITLIGEAHIENLGSRAGIAKAKMEIVAGLKTNGLFLIPAGEPLLAPLIQGLPQQIRTFGLETGDICGTVLHETQHSTTFLVDKQEYQIPVIGGYNVKNALIAIAFGRYFGVDTAAIIAGLAEFQLTKNRTQWLTAKNGAKVLSDVYNANPTAMALVLDSFAHLAMSGRKLVVLADMLELGPDSKCMHAAMKDHLSKEYEVIFLYGEQMHALYEVLKEEERHVLYFNKEDKDALIGEVKQELKATDNILLKGSNGMGLAEVIEALQK